MQWKKKADSSMKQVLSYLKDYRFSSILVKYFLLLLICLVLPVAALSVWYGNQMRKNLEEEMIKRNETSLEQVYENVNSIIMASKNLAYSLSVSEDVQYLGTKNSIDFGMSKNVDVLMSMLEMERNSSDYIDSICIYFEKNNSYISKQGVLGFEEYTDKECLDRYSEDTPNRTVFWARKKHNKYPYLLSILQPISEDKNSNLGAVIINIDVEKLGEFIGSGRYRNKDYSSTLLIYDDAMENLIYSDEYRFLNEEEHFEVGIAPEWEGKFSKMLEIEDASDSD